MSSARLFGLVSPFRTDAQRLNSVESTHMSHVAPPSLIYCGSFVFIGVISYSCQCGEFERLTEKIKHAVSKNSALGAPLAEHAARITSNSNILHDFPTVRPPIVSDPRTLLIKSNPKNSPI